MRDSRSLASSYPLECVEAEVRGPEFVYPWCSASPPPLAAYRVARA